ncbi:MAG: hypothetical protein H6R10_2225 [Rhodocyclaceae bacterium]|nr:hypothetical protein [Rhodocyclaceae bacterium]
MMTIKASGWLAAVAVALAACGPLPPPGPAKTGPVPAGFPEAYYRQAQARGEAVLRVDAARSLAVVEVRRAGVLARLGHDHVVAGHGLQGYVAPGEGRADLYLALDRLQVDEPGLRAEAGFDTQPSREAIEGTRGNMLDKVLETGRFPFALIHVTRKDDQTLVLALTLHGVTRELEVPARIESLPDGMAVSGRLAFNQSDFGIVPFSVLGGALQVQDRVDLRFRIHAVRTESLEKAPAAPAGP